MRTIAIIVTVAGIVLLQAAALASPARKVVLSTSFDSPEALGPWTAVGDGRGRAELVAGTEGEGSCVRVTRSAEAGAGTTMLRIRLPIEEVRGGRVGCSARLKALEVAKPPMPYNGVKFMLHSKGPGGPRWDHPSNLLGTFDWRAMDFVAGVPADAAEAWLLIGLEATTGTAWFDDIVVRVYPPRPRPTADAKASARQPGATQYRGAMIATRPSEEDLRTLGGKWGANVVRWQLHRPEVNYGTDPGTDMAAYDAWLADCLAHVEKLLPVCEELGLHVVIDLHTPPGGHGEGYVHRVFRDQGYQAKFLDAWEEIARRFKGREIVWAFDLLNEPVEGIVPQGVRDWHDLATETSHRIRQIDPQRTIMIEPAPWGTPEAIEFLWPLELDNVVYSVHMYAPHLFTHQGVFNNPVGVMYPGKVAGRQWDKEALRAVLKPVVEFQRDYGVPIFIGEFSAARWAPDQSAARYLGDVIELFEEYGWDWAYHAFREWHGWSVEHGADARDTRPTAEPTPRQRLLESWFSKNAR